jgi:putative hydrolase of the HAD superfamily
MTITTIGLDADDTLWESEVHFVDVENRFRELIARYDPSDDIQTHLLTVERRNLDYFGYGVMSFTLSMIETAIQLTDGAVDGDDIHVIVSWGKEMMKHPVDLLPDVRDTLEVLSSNYELIIITKGDLLHQQAKVAQSGLAEVVDAVEVLTEKDVASYKGVLAKHNIAPARFLMAGNSVKSDVLPVLELSAHAVHIPSSVTWAVEADHEGDATRDGFHVLDSIRDLPDLAVSIG